MKKKYINPDMCVIEMKTQHMMMMSNLGSTDATSGNLGHGMDGDFEDEDF